MAKKKKTSSTKSPYPGISTGSVVSRGDGHSSRSVGVPARNIAGVSGSGNERHWLHVDVVDETRLLLHTNGQLGQLRAVSATCVFALELLSCLGRHPAWALEQIAAVGYSNNATSYFVLCYILYVFICYIFVIISVSLSLSLSVSLYLSVTLYLSLSLLYLCLFLCVSVCLPVSLCMSVCLSLPVKLIHYK